MRNKEWTAVLCWMGWALVFCLSGCGDTNTGDQDGGDHDGIEDGNICNEVHFEASKVPPNLLIVADTSGSMGYPTCDACTRTKLEDLKDAVYALLNQGEGEIRFGWMNYPDMSGFLPEGCEPGVVSVGISDNSANDIRGVLAVLGAEGGTPTGGTLQAANNYQPLHDATRQNFVMLVTDGVPTCPNGDGSSENEADNQLALQAVRALHSASIDTFVIGLGTSIADTNPGLLSQMATEGGRPRSGNPKYYQANSVSELEAIFQEIGGSVMSCTMSLGTAVPEYPDYLWVYLDNQLVPRDRNKQNGWDYDPVRNQISFYGTWCDMLRNDQVQNVNIKMGCAPPT
jgi:hypothetical protein